VLASRMTEDLEDSLNRVWSNPAFTQKVGESANAAQKRAALNFYGIL
jgi:hypothetical protein